ncbi:MAG: HPr family phosphocarrier protein [Blautia sp.]|nr:HPr family phosphocarrier protein [Blautia sp.]
MTRKIRFQDPEEVREFVRAASKCDFDIDVSYNRIVVDAKSYLGILGMDLSNNLTVTCHGEDKEFEKLLQKFTVA